MKTIKLRHTLFGIVLAASTMQLSVPFQSTQKVYAQSSAVGESIPNYIFVTSGQPSIAVFEGRRESFALGCPEIRDAWSAVLSQNVSGAEFSSLLSINPVVADLRCDGSILGYGLSDEGPGLLLITHRDGTPHRHYINSPLFLTALRSGDLIARDGPEFRAVNPQRGNDLRVSLASEVGGSSTLYLSPETSATVTAASGPQSFGGGWAEADAELSRSGLLTVSGHARSDHCTRATRGRALVVGYDSLGRDVFVSQDFNIPTASGKCDLSGHDEIRKTFTQSIHADLSSYVASLRVLVDRRDGPSLREQITGNITEACGTYDDLPPTARQAIAIETGFPGCYPENLAGGG